MHPKLRPVETSLTQYEGQPCVLLRDPLGLSGALILIPRPLAPLLALCDGTRERDALRAAFELRTGMPLSPTLVDEFIRRLDEALLLDNDRAAQARDAALMRFRVAPSRPAALAGGGYPANPDELRHALGQYADGLPGTSHADASSGLGIRGLITPHIDFARGGPVYAQTWMPARQAIKEIELAIILGTDHRGGRNLLTLTRQSYSTPWGVLPTAGDEVARLSSAIGCQAAFEDELNHRDEHSIELAVIWLHYLLKNQRCRLVPVLCGSLDRFLDDDAGPREDAQVAAAVDAMRQATKSRRSLIVAAADLAHIGPAFGDRLPVDGVRRSKTTAADDTLVKAICAVDAEEFFAQVKRERNQRRICGLAPIYLALRVLGEGTGKSAGYAQCPADDSGGSLVSICGALIR